MYIVRVSPGSIICLSSAPPSSVITAIILPIDLSDVDVDVEEEWIDGDEVMLIGMLRVKLWMIWIL